MSKLVAREGVEVILGRRKSIYSGPEIHDFCRYPIIQYVISSLSHAVNLFVHLVLIFSSNMFG